MTRTLTGLANSTAAVDVVGVYTQNYVQVFRNARPLKAFVRLDSQLPEHPLETGEVRVDHQIFRPIEIELPLITQTEAYREIYQEIRQLYQSNTLLIVQTKSDTYDNQLIQSLPHEENPDAFGQLLISLRLKQVIFFSATESVPVPKNPNNSATVDRGNQQPTAATPIQEEKSSVLFRSTLGT